MRYLVAVAVFLLGALPAQAHFSITSPTAGRAYAPGASVDVALSISVHHDPGEVFDVALSEDGGDFADLVTGLDDTEFPWSFLLPDHGIDEAVLQVVQHGPDGYRYVQTVAFTVVGGQPDPPPVVDAGDAANSDATDTAGGAELPSPEDVPVPRDVAVPPDPGPGPADVDLDVGDGGGGGGGLPAPTTVEAVGTVFASSCAVNQCHAGTTPAAGLDLSLPAFPGSLVGVPATQSGGTRVVPCDSNGSVLPRRLDGLGVKRMPPEPDAPLTPAARLAIRQWIDNGAASSGAISVAHPELCPAPPGADAAPDGASEGPAASSGDGSGGCGVSASGRPDVWTTVLMFLALVALGIGVGRRHAHPDAERRRRS